MRPLLPYGGGDRIGGAFPPSRGLVEGTGVSYVQGALLLFAAFSISAVAAAAAASAVSSPVFIVDAVKGLRPVAAACAMSCTRMFKACGLCMLRPAACSPPRATILGPLEVTAMQVRRGPITAYRSSLGRRSSEPRV